MRSRARGGYLKNGHWSMRWHERPAMLSRWRAGPRIRRIKFVGTLPRRSRKHSQARSRDDCNLQKSTARLLLESRLPALDRWKVWCRTKLVLGDIRSERNWNSQSLADNKRFRQSSSFFPKSRLGWLRAPRQRNFPPELANALEIALQSVSRRLVRFEDCSVKGTSFAYDFSDSGYDGNRFLLARLQTCGDPELVVVGTKVERRQMHRL